MTLVPANPAASATLPRDINIAGLGLAGALLALLLARRGHRVTVFERRPDPRLAGAESGRSINLALAARGIRALERAGIMDQVWPLLIAMRGRMVHGTPAHADEAAQPPQLQPYGQRPHEVIHSVGRGQLNTLLIEAVARHPEVTLHFDTGITGVDLEQGTLGVRHLPSRELRTVPLGFTFATDGAGSVVRHALAACGHIEAREDPLDHGYKELMLPARTDCAGNAQFALEPHALHIWPRRGYMLIALPNPDRSFTVTLFLPQAATPTAGLPDSDSATPGAAAKTTTAATASFAALRTDADVDAFFQREFPDVKALIPDLTAQFATHAQGHLGTVHARPWAAGPVLLLGDAAHAIVPFHGQGMNAAFEDCVLLDDILHDPANTGTPWPELFRKFEASRRPDTEAIASLSLDNYAEMRSDVLDPKFVRQKALGLELERRFPDRFIPEYAMVMFHPRIAYADAQRRGRLQQRILDQLDEARLPDGAPDFALARRLIAEHL